MSSVNDRLIGAAKAGDLESALRVIRAGANVNAVDGAGAAALHHAAAAGNADMTKLLLAKGANPDLPSGDMFIGSSAISIACLNEYFDVVQVLRQYGADLSGKLEGGRCALHHAAAGGRTQMCAVLIGLGLDIDIKDKEGWTPLHWATGNEKIETIEFLIESGADLEAQDEYGDTALLHAISGAKLEAIGALLRLGANIPDRVLDDDYLDTICGDAAPEERAWIDRGVRMVRAAAISRGIEKAFSDDHESCDSPRTSSPSLSL